MLRVRQGGSTNGSWRRHGALVLAALIVLPLALAAVSDAVAQDDLRPRRNFLQRLLFGDYPEPPRQIRPAKPRKKAVKVRRAPSARRLYQPGDAQPPAEVAKAADARIVLVVGDFLGSRLAEGLAEAYAQSPTVTVVDKTEGSSGFVRDDHYDWPSEVASLIDEVKPAAVVMMLGSNDRQQMRIGEAREEKGSDAWLKEYEARATLFAAAVADKKVPLVWVGMPSFKAASMSSDMLAFNDIYRSVAENAKDEFVDVWDGFVDENGAFVLSGPDVNGQPVKLRTSDGVNFTDDGKRKLAFYAEKPLEKILGTLPPPTAGAPGPAVVPDLARDPDAIAKIDRTAPISLSDPELDGGADLLGYDTRPREKPRTPAEKLAIEGIGPAASPGRADDFSGSPKAAAAPPVAQDPQAVPVTSGAAAAN